MKKTEYHSTAETKKQAVTLLTSPSVCVFPPAAQRAAHRHQQRQPAADGHFCRAVGEAGGSSSPTTGDQRARAAGQKWPFTHTRKNPTKIPKTLVLISPLSSTYSCHRPLTTTPDSRLVYFFLFEKQKLKQSHRHKDSFFFFSLLTLINETQRKYNATNK